MSWQTQEAQNFLKIDAHNHIIPADIPPFRERFGYGGFIELEHHRPGFARMMRDGEFFREIKANCWNPEVRLEECDRWGIDVQVMCTIPVMFSYWAPAPDALEVARFLNDHLAEVVQRYPHRFVGLATVPLQDTDLAVKELERSVQELGLAGVQIGSHVNDMNLDAPELFPFFEAAQDLGAAILVHPWDMMGKEKMPKYWLPWLVGMPAETSLAMCSMIFGGVFERLPQLSVMFSHGGGSFPSTLARIEHGFNVRPDLVAVDNNVNPRSYIGRFFIDSVVHDPKTLRFVMDVMGEDSIMLGSDYPFPLGELEPGRMLAEMEDLATSTKQKLYSENALRWLNLDANQFQQGATHPSSTATPQAE